jgi:hypothetical protein
MPVNSARQLINASRGRKIPRPHRPLGRLLQPGRNFSAQHAPRGFRFKQPYRG